MGAGLPGSALGAAARENAHCWPMGDRKINEARRASGKALREAAKSQRRTAEELNSSSELIEKAARATAREADSLPPEDRPYKARIAEIRAEHARILHSEADVKQHVAERLEHQADAETAKGGDSEGRG